MKKYVKAMAAGFAAVGMLMGLASCGPMAGNLDDLVKDKEIEFETADAIGNVIEFKVTEDTTGTSNKITLKYRRSEAGAAEKITLQGAKYNLWKNGDKEITTKTGDLAFNVNSYGSCFCFAEGVDAKAANCTGNHYDENGKIADDANCAEYQVELTYANKLKKGDVVKFQLVSAKVTGEGAAAAATILPKVKAVLIDADKAVDWYKEVFDYKKESEGGAGYPKVIKDGATVETGTEEDHGLLDSSYNTGAWATAVTIPGTTFADTEAGDKLVVTYDVNNDGEAGYHMFQICDGADVATQIKEVADLSAAGEYTYTFKSADLEALKANGVAFQGNGVTITKVTLVKGDGTEPEEPAGPTPDENGKVVLVSNLTLGWGGNDVISKDVTLTKGDVIYFTVTATGAQEVQFIKKGWAGGLGKNVITILDADENDVTYYAGPENCTDDEKDRPAVSLDSNTATFHFVVTDEYLAVKDVAVVVGSAKIDEMYYTISK